MTQIILTEEDSISLALNSIPIEEFASLLLIELKKTIDFSKTIEIKDFDDKGQFEIVKDTKNKYVKTRNSILRVFKTKRDKNTEENRKNIEVQNSVIEELEKEEKRLDEMVQKAETMKLRKENEGKLAMRQEELAKFEHIQDVESLLNMKEKDFETLLTSARVSFLDKKEAELKVEQERITREKELEEAKKQARLEAEEKSKKDLEDAEKRRIEDIAKLKAEQEAKELAIKQRLETEEQARLEAEKRLAEETEYRKWLSENQGKYDKIIKEDGKVVLYKKVSEYLTQ